MWQTKIGEKGSKHSTKGVTTPSSSDPAPLNNVPLQIQDVLNLQFYSLYSPFVLVCNRFSKRDDCRLSIRGSRSGCRRDGRIRGRFLFSKKIHHYLFFAINCRLSVPLWSWNDGILSSAVFRSSSSFELSKSLTTVVSFGLLNEDEARTIWFFSSLKAVLVVDAVSVVVSKPLPGSWWSLQRALK